MAVTAVAAPKGKVPSTVISAKFKIRKVKYKPNPSNAHNNPCPIAETIKFII